MGFFHFFMRGFAFLAVSYTAAVFSNYGGGGGKILLTGPNANSIWAMCGDYSFPSMA